LFDSIETEPLFSLESGGDAREAIQTGAAGDERAGR
jgi:hypothetical protein